MVARLWLRFLAWSHLHKYAMTAAMAATSYGGEGPLFLLDYVLRIGRVAILLTLWRTVFRSGVDGAEMPLEAVLTYTLIAEVFALQLNAKTRITDTLWDGSIAVRFLQPVGLVGQFASEMMGHWLFVFVTFSVPLLLVAPAIGVSPLPASPAAGLASAVSLCLAISVGLAMDFIFGALTTLFDQNVWMVSYLRNAVSTVLAGALFPLAFFPWRLGEVFAWLPFAAMASAPLRIFTGSGEVAQLLAMQVGWSLLLWPVAMWMWRINREQLVIQGG